MQIPLQVLPNPLAARTRVLRSFAGQVKHSLTIFTPESKREEKHLKLNERTKFNKNNEQDLIFFLIFQVNVPGGAFKLKGEDDVIGVTYLTNEAALGAQVAVEHVVGGVLRQRRQVVCIFPVCDLR